MRMNFGLPRFSAWNWSGWSPVWVSVGMAGLCLIASLLYGPINFSNPFYVLQVFFQTQAAVLLAMVLWPVKKNAEVKKASILGSLKLITLAVIIGFTAPQQNLLLLLVPVIVVCLIMSGGQNIWTVWGFLADKHHDTKEFNKAMKETAETARLEEALSLDLERFLTGADSAGKQKQ